MPVDKSGRVYVVGSVPVLHPEAQTVDEMLEGWRNQQLCRNLDHDTIAGRVRLVERFIEHTNEFPWTWTPAMVEEFFSDLRSVKRRKQSTVRRYQNAAKTQRLVSSTVALRRCRVMAATDLSGLLWDEHHPAAGSFPSRPDVLDPAQWLPLGLQMQLAAGDHFE